MKSDLVGEPAHHPVRRFLRFALRRAAFFLIVILLLAAAAYCGQTHRRHTMPNGTVHANCECGWRSAPYGLDEPNTAEDVQGALSNHLLFCDVRCSCTWSDDPRRPDNIHPDCTVHSGVRRITSNLDIRP